MRRKTNVHMWRYIGPVVMNKLKKACVICESFMIEERNTAYYFALKSNFYGTKFLKRTQKLYMQMIFVVRYSK